jgi:uncharacterized membrane protein YgcG
VPPCTPCFRKEKFGIEEGLLQLKIDKKRPGIDIIIIKELLTLISLLKIIKQYALYSMKNTFLFYNSSFVSWTSSGMVVVAVCADESADAGSSCSSSLFSASSSSAGGGGVNGGGSL